MVVYPERMRENLERSRGVVFSGTVLLELARRGVSREQAYEWVQRNAMRAFNEQRRFQGAAAGRSRMSTAVLPAAEIERAFDLDEQLRHVDDIFEPRVPGGGRLMRARVFVTLKPSVFDPQGTTVAEALHTLGYAAVKDVRQGKYFELEIDAGDGGRSAAAGVGGGRQAARESRDRELSHRSGFRVSAEAVTMKFAVVVFPGSNCDHDAYHAVKHVLGQDAVFVWHKDTSLRAPTPSSCPAGSPTATTCGPARSRASLRSCARSKRFADAGGPVLGICNGFQVLLEAGLLPGAMLRNRSVKFQCEHVIVKVEQTDTPFTSACRPGQVLRIPIAHGEGNYYAEPDVVERLEKNRQVIFRYTTPTGEVTPPRPIRMARSITSRAVQRATQRRRPDAPSRARLRAGCRQRRRPGRPRIGREVRDQGAFAAARSAKVVAAAR